MTGSSADAGTQMLNALDSAAFLTLGIFDYVPWLNLSVRLDVGLDTKVQIYMDCPALRNLNVNRESCLHGTLFYTKGVKSDTGKVGEESQ